MHFIQCTFLAVVALVGLVMAGENPIIFPDSSSKIVAGSPFTITWTVTAGSTVTFKLRKGPSGNLNDVEVIVSGAPNTGSYQWTPESTLPSGTDYAIMITDDKGDVNYTPLITINSNVPPTVESSSTTAPSSTSKSSSSSSSSSSSGSSSSTSSAKASSTHTTEASSTITSATSSPTPVTQAYANTTMITSSIGYSNATATGNSTLSSTRSSSPTTSSKSGPNTTASSISTGAASGLLKSPLALVVCVLGAVLYLN